MWNAQQAVLLLAALSAGLAVIAAESDCSVPKPIDPNSIKACCNAPNPKLDVLPGDCMNQKMDGPLPPGQDFWCKVECMFKASDVIQDHELNMPAVRILVDKVYQHEPEFADAFYKAFEDCAPVIKSEVERYRSSGAPTPSFKCSPLPMTYVNCAQTNMLRHCPTKAWQSTDSCAASRTYLTNCGKEILELERQKWAPRPGL